MKRQCPQALKPKLKRVKSVSKRLNYTNWILYPVSQAKAAYAKAKVAATAVAAVAIPATLALGAFAIGA